MSREAKNEVPFFNPRKIVAGVVSVLALGSVIKYGPEALDDTMEALARSTTKPSLIVAGVPGQIESYDSRRVWTGKFFVNKYWLGIEQCPADITAAEEGNPTVSYNPDLGYTNPECNFDWVRVSGGTYSSVTVGNEIAFEGELGEPLRK
jgi:hypothetical protein